MIDDAEQQAEGAEVQQAVQEGGRAKEGLSPRERQPFRGALAGRARVPFALLLEAGAHEQQRDGRTGIGEGIGEEGKGATGFEQGSAQRRPDDAHRRRPATLCARRCRQLSCGHHGPQRARLGRVEDGAADALDEGDARKDPEGDPPDDEADRKAADGGGPQCVGGDHQTTTIPSVRQQTGRDGEQRNGGGAREGDDTGLHGGVGQRESQERVGDGRRLRPGIRQELTRLEEDEVAVAPEGNGRHSATLSR